MVRRTKSEAQATRDSLLDAAEQTFCRLGVARTTLDDVARAAGVTRGAVYWHFSGKAELFRAMCERSVLPLEHMLEQASLRSHDDPLAALADALGGSLQAIASSPRTRAVLEILLSKCETAAEPGEQQPCMRTSDCNSIASLERLLKQAVARGQLPKDTDVAVAALAINAFVSGLVRQWVIDAVDFDLGEVGPRLLQMMIEGLRAAPPRRRARSRQRVGTMPRSSAATLRT